MKEETTKVAELLHGVVCAPHRLHALLASHTNADMGGADHAHIIRSIAAATTKQ